MLRRLLILLCIHGLLDKLSGSVYNEKNKQEGDWHR